MENYYIMDTEFPFGKMEEFCSWIMIMAAQCTLSHWIIHTKMIRMISFMLYFVTIVFKTHCLVVIFAFKILDLIYVSTENLLWFNIIRTKYQFPLPFYCLRRQQHIHTFTQPKNIRINLYYFFSFFTLTSKKLLNPILFHLLNTSQISYFYSSSQCLVQVIIISCLCYCSNLLIIFIYSHIPLWSI